MERESKNKKKESALPALFGRCPKCNYELNSGINLVKKIKYLRCEKCGWKKEGKIRGKILW